MLYWGKIYLAQDVCDLSIQFGEVIKLYGNNGIDPDVIRPTSIE